ncbi:cellulose biosynthesis protein BcsE [Pseudomonas sp. 3A(2025)]
MGPVTLAIRHLQDEHILLRQGGLYWIALDHVADAQTLACQFLGALPATQAATLVCVGSEPEVISDRLAADQGPATLRLFAIAAEVAAPAVFHSLIVDLQRIRLARGSQLVLMLPADWLDTFDALELQRWCARMRPWLLSFDATLLVLSSGQSPQLHECLLGFNEQLSGLAQLYRQDGAIHYQLNYWHSQLGVCAAQMFDLQECKSGFALSKTQRSSAVQARTDDQRIYLTQRLVLEGTAPLSGQWRMFEQRDELLQQARSARAASVIVAIESNQDVELLASQLHDLRDHCGVALKIIVREMEPCLRYRDERLLLASGANLIVPCNTSLANFLSLVESAQSQVWRQREGRDFESLFNRLRPPDVRGLLCPKEFIDLLDQVYNGATGELDHQLLRLQPRGELNVEQYLSQITLRRFGDVACVVDGYFYLFLFACRGDGLEPALGNVCRLPWRDLFSDCTVLAGVDALPRQAFVEAPVVLDLSQQAVQQVTADLHRSINQAGFVPQRITLTLSEPSS